MFPGGNLKIWDFFVVMKKSSPVGFGGPEGVVDKANLYASFCAFFEGVHELFSDGVVVDDEALEVNVFGGMTNGVKHLGVGLVSADERCEPVTFE